MFVSVLELTLGGIVIVLVYGWFALDNRWLSGRIDQIEYELAVITGKEGRLGFLEHRVDKAEDWVKHLDERTRHQAGARPPEPVWHRPLVIDAVTTDDAPDPGTVPMTVPGPTTEPINLPATQPQGAILLGHWSEGIDEWKVKRDAEYEEFMARIAAMGESSK